MAARPRFAAGRLAGPYRGGWRPRIPGLSSPSRGRAGSSAPAPRPVVPTEEGRRRTPATSALPTRTCASRPMTANAVWLADPRRTGDARGGRPDARLQLAPPAVADRLRPMAPAALPLLQFDFRGHGDSDDAPITLGTLEQRDVAAAVRFLQGRGLWTDRPDGHQHGRLVAIMPLHRTCRSPRWSPMPRTPSSRTRSPTACGRGAIRCHGWARGWWLRPPASGRGRSCGSRSSGSAQIAPRGLLLIAPREDRLVD